MTRKTSAGLLMFKRTPELKVFLVHPGGPFWKDKDEGAWSIPKGEIEDGDLTKENMLENAMRELKEETGIEPLKEKDKYFYLKEVKQKSGKIVHAWAFESDWSGLLMCQSFTEIEWPPRSNKKMKVPEVDRANFFSIEKAKSKIIPAQFEFVERLKDKLQ